MITSPVTHMNCDDLDFEISRIALVATTRNLIWYFLAARKRDQLSAEPIDAVDNDDRRQGAENAESDDCELAPESITSESRSHIISIR